MGIVGLMNIVRPNRAMNMHRTWKLIATMLGCMLTASGVALAATSVGTSPTAARGANAAARPHNVPPLGSSGAAGVAGQPSSGPSGLISAPDRVDTEAFAVLRRPRTAEDDVPTTVHVALSASSGANIALAQKVQSPAGTAYVIPGKGTMCLMSGSASEGESGAGGAGCVPDGAATQGYLEMEERGGYALNEAGSAMTFVSGLVPDGVSQVTVHLSDGGTAVVQVKDNVYMREVRGEVSEVTFTTRSGAMTVGREG